MMSDHPVEIAIANNPRAQRFTTVMSVDIPTLLRLRSLNPERHSALVREHQRREQMTIRNNDNEDEDEDDDDSEDGG